MNPNTCQNTVDELLSTELQSTIVPFDLVHENQPTPTLVLLTSPPLHYCDSPRLIYPSMDYANPDEWNFFEQVPTTPEQIDDVTYFLQSTCVAVKGEIPEQ